MRRSSKWLPQIASGEAIGTLALFEGKGNPSPQAIKLAASGGSLNGVKKPVPDGAIADFAIVAARTGSSGRDTDISLFLVDMKAGGVEAQDADQPRPVARPGRTRPSRTARPSRSARPAKAGASCRRCSIAPRC